MLQAKIITDDHITVVLDDTTYTMARGHTNFSAVIKALKDRNDDALVGLFAPVSLAAKLGKGFSVVADEVLYNGKHLDPAMSKVLFSLIRDGFDVEPYLNFQNNLMDNPSYKTREQLFRFIAANKITITDDGELLLYKRVNKNRNGDGFVDVYTGKIDNSIGRTVEMDRGLVDDNPDNTCSKGLHAASLPYIKHYRGDTIVLVRVNPADVVSIPTDYNDSKMRVCRYEVEAIHLGDENTEATESSVYGYNALDQLDSYFEDEVISY